VLQPGGSDGGGAEEGAGQRLHDGEDEKEHGVHGERYATQTLWRRSTRVHLNSLVAPPTELQGKLEETEQTALKGGKKQLHKMETRVSERL